MGSRLRLTAKPQEKSEIRLDVGEFFYVKYTNLGPGNCFVCGVRKSHNARGFLLHTLTAFAVDNESGDRVVAMFSKGVECFHGFGDEPKCVLVSACDEHLENLKKLVELTKDGIITNERVREAEGKKGVNLDELQAEAEKLVVLLKEREPGLMSWNMCVRERLEGLHKLISQALNK